MKTLAALFGAWFVWYWVVPLVMIAIIALLYTIYWVQKGIRWWWANIKNQYWQPKPQLCWVPGCKEEAHEDVWVVIKFKEGRDGLKEKWRTCKGCAKKLDHASMTLEWLHWYHITSTDPKDSGWYQHKPKE